MAEPDAPRAHRHRRIAAPPGRVWRVLEHRDLRRQVLGGDLDVALEPGATGTFDDGVATRPVRVDEVDAPHRLAFEWGEGDEAAHVDIRLVPAGDGTDVHVTEVLGGASPLPTGTPTDPTALALAA